MHASLHNTSDRMRLSLDLRFNPVGEPTGRSALPAFVARSRSRPESEMNDPVAWARMWAERRTQIVDYVAAKTKDGGSSEAAEAAGSLALAMAQDNHGEPLSEVNFGRGRWINSAGAIYCA
jgi:hypothetical protein